MRVPIKNNCCGETYLFFRVDEETEALDVSHSKLLCSSPLEHISPEAEDYEPPLKRLSKESSNESIDEETADSRRQLIPSEDSNKLYKCQFSGDSVSWYRSHFEIVHGVKDKKSTVSFPKMPPTGVETDEASKTLSLYSG